jgi:peptidoglycan/xylan/chitin deacetylase (PgdA/CDA1 family)
MKNIAKTAFCALVKYSGALRALEMLPRRPFLSVLLFHRVTDEIAEDGLTVSTRRFAGMCRLFQRTFHVASLAELFRLHRSGEPYPPRTLAITFDDCYRDNLNAARILADHGLPACFFIPTSFVGTNHVFDWDRDKKPLANLNWDEVREMARLGHEIGSHTCTHPDMAQIPKEQARHELVESKRILDQQIGRPTRWFAYPFGGKNNFRLDLLPILHEAGYEGCLSGHGGCLYPNDPGLIVPREPVPSFPTTLNLELHLRGGMNWFHGLKRRVGLLPGPPSELLFRNPS